MKVKGVLTNADTRQLFENGSIIVFKCEANESYNITFVSANSRDILGFSSEYFIDNITGWSSQIHPDDKEEVDRKFKVLLNRGGSSINEYRFKRKDGEYIWVRDEIKLQVDDQGKPISILGACFEITGRKRLEIEAKQSMEGELRKRLNYQNALSRCSNLFIDGTGPKSVEKALQILLETTEADRVYIFKTDKNAEGEYEFSQTYEVCRSGVKPEITNPLMQQMPFNSLPWVFSELSKNNVVNTPIRKLPSPEREFMLNQFIKSFLLLPIFIEDEWFGFLGFDDTRGERVWDEHEVTLLKTAADIIGTFFRRKSVEESLLQQKNFTQQLLDSLPSIVVLMNKDYEILQWNKTAEKHTGYTSDELKQKTALDIIAPEDHQQMNNALKRILSKNDVEGEELQLLHKNGKKALYFWRGDAVEVDGSAVFVIVGLNIDRQKEMEHALVEEKRLADAIINSMPGVFYVIDKNENFVRVNKNFLKEFEYSEYEVKNLSPRSFFDKAEQKMLEENFLKKTLEKGSADIELSPMTKTGETIPYHLKAVRFRRRDEDYILGTGHNISEQKQREAELKASVKEKQVLLQEIHHRVKNNLAVISGLLELQAYEFEDSEFLRLIGESQRRIQTMAMIHEKLYQSASLSRISVLNYIDDLISQIESSFNIRKKDISVETKIEDIELNINQAIPFALAVNEIISNSFEHAFKGKNKGKVIVELGETDGHIITVIKDNGVGMDEEKEANSTSLGMTLIKALLSQIEADWERKSEGGVCYRITFPKDTDKGSSSTLSTFTG